MSCEDCATNFDLAYDMVTDRYADLLAAAVADAIAYAEQRRVAE
jgi:transcriptional regulator GlxA family with amidase domain